MVFDVDKLKEAVELWDGPDSRLEGVYVHTIYRLFDAARMVVAGQPLWWCERHQQAVWIAGGKSCYAYAVGNETTRCVMVEGWWMPTGKDET